MIQAYSKNVAQAQSVATTAAGAVQAIKFSTLLAIAPTCPYSVNKALTVVYTGSAGTMTLSNIIVTKIR